MKFTKMHGCGNDYIYVNCFKEDVPDPVSLSIRLSDRRFGIGSDGLILIKPSEVADFMMDMYNLDGSRGKMCGNGIRCVGKYVYDNGLTDKLNISVETLSGIKYLEMKAENGKVESVRVDMGSPVIKPADIPVDTGVFTGDKVVSQKIKVPVPGIVPNDEVEITCVSMGNPHAVIFVDDAENAPVHTLGPVLEKSAYFPEQSNIEFVQLKGCCEIRMRVWERGSGETSACGTGACASAMACILNGKTRDKVKVHMNGGDVEIEYDRESDTVFMTGPATKVFDGEIEI